MGVRVQESTEAPARAARAEPSDDLRAVPLDDPGFVDFAVAGAELAGEFRCADCGYGAVIQSILPICPMCAGSVWEKRGPLAGRR